MGKSSYQYEGNVLTLQITSRGGMSTSGGESLISQYSHNDDGGLECHTVSSTEEARQYGTDVYCLALETIRIDYTPENAAKLRQMQAELDALDDGNNWFSLSYQTVLSTFEKYFPDYDTSTLRNEFSRVDAEKKQRSEYAEGSALVNISVESPQTPGLVTDSDISSTTSATFDSAVFLLMGEESAGSDEDPRPALSVPTDLADSAGKDARRLRQQFIDDYILSAGYECLTQVELTSRYAHDAYTPNEEIYEIEEKYTGALGSIHRLFAGNFPAYNKLTGSCEYITHSPAAGSASKHPVSVYIIWFFPGSDRSSRNPVTVIPAFGRAIPGIPFCATGLLIRVIWGLKLFLS